MTARNAKAESTTETKGEPIKRLVLRRETVRDLKVRTGVKTGTMFAVSPIYYSPVDTSTSGKSLALSSNVSIPPASVVYSGIGVIGH